MASVTVRVVDCYVYLKTDDGLKFLLLKRNKKKIYEHLWQGVAGKIEEGETAPEAAIRELNEETGLKIDDIKFILVQDCIGSKEFYREEHFLLLNYTCRCIGSTEVALNDEAQAFLWVDPREAMEMDLNKPTRILLEALLGDGHNLH